MTCRPSAIPMASVMSAVCWGTLAILAPLLVVLVTSEVARGLVRLLAEVLR